MSISIKTAPDPHDVTDFRFQGLRKVNFIFSSLKRNASPNFCFQIRLGDKESLSGSHGGLLAVVPKAGVVLVAGHKCVYVVKTKDVEDQDKICNKQERAVENSNISKVRH